MAQATEHRTDATHDGGHDHPSYWSYVWIGAILTVITIVEVLIYDIEALAGVIVPLLLVLSGLKFVLVVMFYMHLKMDSRIFSSVFFAPMALAVFLVIALFVLYKVVPNFG